MWKVLTSSVGFDDAQLETASWPSIIPPTISGLMTSVQTFKTGKSAFDMSWALIARKLGERCSPASKAGSQRFPLHHAGIPESQGPTTIHSVCLYRYIIYVYIYIYICI